MIEVSDEIINYLSSVVYDSLNGKLLFGVLQILNKYLDAGAENQFRMFVGDTYLVNFS